MENDRKWRKRKSRQPPSKIEDEDSLEHLIETQCAEIPIGEWFAMVGKELVAHGPDFDEVLKVAREKHPDRELFIDRLPKPGPMILI